MILRFADNKKKRRTAGIAGGVAFFNARQQMKPNIDRAHRGIYSHLQAVDSRLQDGVALSKAVNGLKIKSSMDVLISASRLKGFQQASTISGAMMPVDYGKEIAAAAADRATEVDKMMARTTKRRLNNDLDNEYVLSAERSLAASAYESAKGYYQGVSDALAGYGDVGLLKQWFTTSDNPCPECEDAEDDGPIDVDDTFSNGLDYPLAHLNCQCFVSSGYDL